MRESASAPKIKICGLRRPEDAEAVNAVRADYAGFVFAESKRRVTPEEARRIRTALDAEIRTVGVFVDAAVRDVAEIYRAGLIDLIQLHGREDAAYIAALRQLVGPAPIIRAARVRTAADILAAQALDCQYLLLDTYIPGLQGGSGRQFDYAAIPPLEKPFFLAGGLTPENVAAAVVRVRPYAVDVSSGVETAGWKDEEKIRRFADAVRRAASTAEGYEEETQCQMDDSGSTAGSSSRKP